MVILFDAACFGTHPIVRATIEFIEVKFRRAEAPVVDGLFSEVVLGIRRRH